MNQTVTRDHGEGWITFVAVLFGILGAFNAIDGLVALAGDERFAADELFFGNLTFWGILLLAIASLQLLTSVLIFKRNANGQGLGIILCFFTLVTQLFFVSVYPIWSLLIIAIAVMIIYGLCVYDSHFK